MIIQYQATTPLSFFGDNYLTETRGQVLLFSLQSKKQETRLDPVFSITFSIRDCLWHYQQRPMAQCQNPGNTAGVIQ